MVVRALQRSKIWSQLTLNILVKQVSSIYDLGITPSCDASLLKSSEIRHKLRMTRSALDVLGAHMEAVRVGFQVNVAPIDNAGMPQVGTVVRFIQPGTSAMVALGDGTSIETIPLNLLTPAVSPALDVENFPVDQVKTLVQRLAHLIKFSNTNEQSMTYMIPSATFWMLRMKAMCVLRSLLPNPAAPIAMLSEVGSKMSMKNNNCNFFIDELCRIASNPVKILNEFGNKDALLMKLLQVSGLSYEARIPLIGGTKEVKSILGNISKFTKSITLDITTNVGIENEMTDFILIRHATPSDIDSGGGVIGTAWPSSQLNKSIFCIPSQGLSRLVSSSEMQQSVFDGQDAVWEKQCDDGEIFKYLPSDYFEIRIESNYLGRVSVGLVTESSLEGCESWGAVGPPNNVALMWSSDGKLLNNFDYDAISFKRSFESKESKYKTKTNEVNSDNATSNYNEAQKQKSHLISFPTVTTPFCKITKKTHFSNSGKFCDSDAKVMLARLASYELTPEERSFKTRLIQQRKDKEAKKKGFQVLLNKDHKFQESDPSTYIRLPEDQHPDFNIESWTICVWMKQDNSSNRCHIICKSVPRENEDVRIMAIFAAADDRTLSLFHSEGDGFSRNQIETPSCLPNDGDWHHIAVCVWTTENPSVAFYVDGLLIKKTSLARNFYDSLGQGNGVVWIGKRHPDDFFLEGHLRDMRFYPRALQASEVSSIYEGNTNTDDFKQSSTTMLSNGDRMSAPAGVYEGRWIEKRWLSLNWAAHMSCQLQLKSGGTFTFKVANTKLKKIVVRKKGSWKVINHSKIPEKFKEYASMKNNGIPDATIRAEMEKKMIPTEEQALFFYRYWKTTTENKIENQHSIDDKKITVGVKEENPSKIFAIELFIKSHSEIPRFVSASSLMSATLIPVDFSGIQTTELIEVSNDKARWVRTVASVHSTYFTNISMYSVMASPQKKINPIVNVVPRSKVHLPNIPSPPPNPPSFPAESASDEFRFSNFTDCDSDAVSEPPSPVHFTDDITDIQRQILSNEKPIHKTQNNNKDNDVEDYSQFIDPHVADALTHDQNIGERVFSREWKIGDTIGVGRDYRNGKILFTRNGKRLGNVYQNPIAKMRPAIWLSGVAACTILPINKGQFGMSCQQYLESMPREYKTSDTIKAGAVFSGLLRYPQSQEQLAEGAELLGEIGSLYEDFNLTSDFIELKVNQRDSKSGHFSGVMSFPNLRKHPQCSMKGQDVSGTISAKDLNLWGVVPKRVGISSIIGFTPNTFSLSFSKDGKILIGRGEHGHSFVLLKSKNEPSMSNVLSLGLNSKCTNKDPGDDDHTGYVLVGRPIELHPPSQVTGLTIEAWVTVPRKDEWTSKQMHTQPIIRYGTEELGLFLRLSENCYETGMHSLEKTPSQTIVSSSIQDEDRGQWVHLAAVYETNSWRFVTEDCIYAPGEIVFSNNDQTVYKTSIVHDCNNIFTNKKLSSGKHYWNIEVDGLGDEMWIGISMNRRLPASSHIRGHADQYSYYNGSRGNRCEAGGTTIDTKADGSPIDTYRSGDIIGCFLDCDNGRIVFYKNGSLQTSIIIPRGIIWHPFVLMDLTSDKVTIDGNPSKLPIGIDKNSLVSSDGGTWYLYRNRVKVGECPLKTSPSNIKFGGWIFGGCAANVNHTSIVNSDVIETKQQNFTEPNVLKQMRMEFRDVRIWHKSLNEDKFEEFQNLCKPLSPQLIGWWPMSSGIGCLAFDRIGQRHGLIANGKWLYKKIPSMENRYEITTHNFVWDPRGCHKRIEILSDVCVRYKDDNGSNDSYRSVLASEPIPKSGITEFSVEVTKMKKYGFVGVAERNQNLSSYCGTNRSGYALYHNGECYNSGSNRVTDKSFRSGTIVRVRVNMFVGSIQWALNDDNWYPAQYTGNLLGKELYPCVTMHNCGDMYTFIRGNDTNVYQNGILDCTLNEELTKTLGFKEDITSKILKQHNGDFDSVLRELFKEKYVPVENSHERSLSEYIMDGEKDTLDTLVSSNKAKRELPVGDLGTRSNNNLMETFDGCPRTEECSKATDGNEINTKKDKITQLKKQAKVHMNQNFWQLSVYSHGIHAMQSLSILFARDLYIALLQNLPSDLLAGKFSSELKIPAIHGAVASSSLLSNFKSVLKKVLLSKDFSRPKTDVVAMPTGQNDTKDIAVTLIDTCICHLFRACHAQRPVSLKSNSLLRNKNSESSDNNEPQDDPEKNHLLIMCDKHALERANPRLSFWLIELLIETQSLPKDRLIFLVKAILRFITSSDGNIRIEAMHTLTLVLEESCTTSNSESDTPTKNLVRQNNILKTMLGHFSGQLETLHEHGSLRDSAYMSALVEMEIALSKLECVVKAPASMRRSRPDWFSKAETALALLDIFSKRIQTLGEMHKANSTMKVFNSTPPTILESKIVDEVESKGTDCTISENLSSDVMPPSLIRVMVKMNPSRFGITGRSPYPYVDTLNTSHIILPHATNTKIVFDVKTEIESDHCIVFSKDKYMVDEIARVGVVSKYHTIISNIISMEYTPGRVLTFTSDFVAVVPSKKNAWEKSTTDIKNVSLKEKITFEKVSKDNSEKDIANRDTFRMKSMNGNYIKVSNVGTLRNNCVLASKASIWLPAYNNGKISLICVGPSHKGLPISINQQCKNELMCVKHQPAAYFRVFRHAENKESKDHLGVEGEFLYLGHQNKISSEDRVVNLPVGEFFWHFPVRESFTWDLQKDLRKCLKGYEKYSVLVEIDDEDPSILRYIGRANLPNRTVICNMPLSARKNSFKVKLISVEKAYIGVCEIPIGKSRKFWHYNTKTGEKASSKDESTYGIKAHDGDIVECVLDKNANTLCFNVNGSFQGIAFTNIHGKSLFPYVTLFQPGDTVQLISKNKNENGKMKTIDRQSPTHSRRESGNLFGVKFVAVSTDIENPAAEEMVSQLYHDQNLLQQEFLTMIHSFEHQADTQLVRYINSVNENTTLTENIADADGLQDSSMVFEAKDAAAYWLLTTRTQSELNSRFSLLQIFNNAVESLLPLIDMSQIGGSSNIGAKMKACRELIYSKPKLKIWHDALEETHASEEDQVSIKINRLESIKYTGQATPTTESLKRSIFGQIYTGLNHLPPKCLRQRSREAGGPHGVWKVKFEGESAIDQGGPFRDTLGQCISDLREVHVGMVIPCPNNRLNDGSTGRDKWVPNPKYKSKDHLHMWCFVGKIMGIALRIHNPLDFDFPSVIWKMIIDEKPTESDMKAIDEGFCQLNKSIREWKDSDGDFQKTLQLNHVVINNNGIEVPLFRGGENTPVTYDSRLKYISLCEEYRLEEIRPQALAMRAGLSTIVPISLLSLWSWEEFQLHVCGKSGFDIDRLKAHTTWKSYNKDHKYQQWLWKSLGELSDAEREGFLRFCWGRGRLPLGKQGWTHNFTVHSKPGKDAALPSAHTCFFQIDLPKYSSQKAMLRALKIAIQWGNSSIDDD